MKYRSGFSAHLFAAITISFFVPSVFSDENTSVGTTENTSVGTTNPSTLMGLIDQCNDGTDDHYYEFPPTLKPSDAICSTRNNPNCTKENVFKMMQKEARFTAPAVGEAAHQPVVNGAQIQLLNLSDITETALKTLVTLRLTEAVRLKADMARALVATEITGSQAAIEQMRKTYDEAVKTEKDRRKNMEELKNSKPMFDNDIILEVIPADYTIVNHTLPDHLFYNGKVLRTVTDPDPLGNIYVKTVGKGTGNKFGVAKCLNLLGQGPIWDFANAQLRDAMKVEVAPILVIDRSGSLNEKPGAMRQIQRQAAQVVIAIRSKFRQAAVINFSGAGNSSATDFTSDSSTLLSAIQGGGGASTGTAIYDAVVKAVEIAVQAKQQAMLIVFTDGMNNQGQGLSTAIGYCKQNKISVIMIGFDGTEGRNVAAMQQLANSTGGFYEQSESVSMERILERFRTFSETKTAIEIKGVAD